MQTLCFYSQIKFMHMKNFIVPIIIIAIPFLVSFIDPGRVYDNMKMASSPVIYKDANFSGNNTYLTCRESNFHRHHWGDKISSIEVPLGWKVVFYRDTGYRGPHFTITGNVRYFSDYGWNDAASSVKVYYNGALQNECSWYAPPPPSPPKKALDDCRNC